MGRRIIEKFKDFLKSIYWEPIDRLPNWVFNAWSSSPHMPAGYYRIYKGRSWLYKTVKTKGGQGGPWDEWKFYRKLRRK
jgi:hypothetical protein